MTARTGWLWPLLVPFRRRLRLVVAAVLVVAGIDLITPYLVEIAIDHGIIAGRSDVLALVMAGYLALTALRFATVRGQVLGTVEIGQQALRRLRMRLFEHLQTLSVEFAEGDTAGRTVARSISDADSIGTVLGDGLGTLLNSIVTVVAVCVIMTLLDWRLALITLLIVPPLELVRRWYSAHSTLAWRLMREAETKVTSHLREALHAVRAVQSYRREAEVAAQIAAANEAENQAERRTLQLSAVFFPSMEFSGTLANLAILAVGGYWASSGQLSAGMLVAFLLYLQAFFGPVLGLSEVYNTFQAAAAGAERIRGTLALRPTVREPDQPASPPTSPMGIRLQGVWFGYPGAERPALSNVDLDVPQGRSLVLVGPTGAGKSTIAKLILRFYDPQHGDIWIGDVDVRRLAGADLRRLVCYVPQNGLLFAGSIADNIRYGRPAVANREVAATVDALGGAPILRRHVSGLDTDVRLLSAGERQLVALCRAWLRDPAVLVLDEATSAMDAEQDMLVRAAVAALGRDRTTITIAHRLTTALTADRIAVVQSGRIVETGMPSELLTPGTAFHRMHSLWRTATV